MEAEIPDCKKEVSDGMDLREELAAAGIPVPGLNTLSVADRDEDTVSVTTRTDDDPVRDAFHHVLDGSDDDEIVWQPYVTLQSLLTRTDAQSRIVHLYHRLKIL